MRLRLSVMLMTCVVLAQGSAETEIPEFLSRMCSSTRENSTLDQPAPFPALKELSCSSPFNLVSNEMKVMKFGLPCKFFTSPHGEEGRPQSDCIDNRFVTDGSSFWLFNCCLCLWKFVCAYGAVSYWTPPVNCTIPPPTTLLMAELTFASTVQYPFFFSLCLCTCIYLFNF